MKTAGLTTLGYSLSDSLGILFLHWSGSPRGPKLRTLPAGNGMGAAELGKYLSQMLFVG